MVGIDLGAAVVTAAGFCSALTIFSKGTGLPTFSLTSAPVLRTVKPKMIRTRLGERAGK